MSNKKSIYAPAWIFGSWLIAVILFILNFSYIVNLGLGSGSAFKYAIGYVGPTAAVAAIASFVVNKFKFNYLSFYKFWFWILVLTCIAYLGSVLTR